MRDESRRNGDEHAGPGEWNVVRLGILNDPSAAIERQRGFECSWRFMKSGMDDATIQAGSFFARTVASFQDADRQALPRELARDGAADNTSAYDADIEHRF